MKAKQRQDLSSMDAVKLVKIEDHEGGQRVSYKTGACGQYLFTAPQLIKRRPTLT